jgi:hypothetical protein
MARKMLLSLVTRGCPLRPGREPDASSRRLMPTLYLPLGERIVGDFIIATIARQIGADNRLSPFAY